MGLVRTSIRWTFLFVFDRSRRETGQTVQFMQSQPSVKLNAHARMDQVNDNKTGHTFERVPIRGERTVKHAGC